jgi:hypothetical protein
MKTLPQIIFLAISVWSLPVQGTVTISFSQMTQGDLTDLTAAGTLDWVKWGNGEADDGLVFATVEKSGGTIINSALTVTDPTAEGQPSVVLATFNPATSILAFSWTDGTATMAGGGPVDNVVTQAMTPAQFSYPIGIGQSFTAAAAAELRVIDVYVQGFDSDMLLTAALSGGASQSIIVSPTVNPVGDAANTFSFGRFRVTYSGVGETLTISTLTLNDGSRVGAQSPFANAGMFAATVTSAMDVPLQINSGLNDAWYNPATNGQGFLITVFPDGEDMFVAWFTFDTERPPEDVSALLGEPGHRWLTAQGSYVGDTANLTIFVTEGGVFDAAVPAATTDPAGDGTMTIEFADCENGLVSYEIASLGISGEIPIQRIVQDNVAQCQLLNTE